MNSPCSTCLKYPICLSKLTLVCKDLTDYLLDVEFDVGLRLFNFELNEWNKDISTITTDGTICFKPIRDNYSAIIIR